MLFKLILILLLLTNISAQADVQTYKVERVVTSRSDLYGDNPHSLATSFAQIEIGAVISGGKKVAVPSRQDFEKVVLVGTEGITTKTLFYESEKRCEFLCGDEHEECHYTALIGWQHDKIGVPLMVVTNLAGKVGNFVSYVDIDVTSAMPSLSVAETPLVWPAHNYLSVSTEGNESSFEILYDDHKNPYRYTGKGKQCRLLKYRDTGLSRLSCHGAEVLLDGQVPLLFSDADYNIPNVQVVNRFSINDQWYYTVMLALKAYTAYGILTKEDGAWRFFVKPADWATIC